MVGGSPSWPEPPEAAVARVGLWVPASVLVAAAAGAGPSRTLPAGGECPPRSQKECSWRVVLDSWRPLGIPWLPSPFLGCWSGGEEGGGGDLAEREEEEDVEVWRYRWSNSGLGRSRGTVAGTTRAEGCDSEGVTLLESFLMNDPSPLSPGAPSLPALTISSEASPMREDVTCTSWAGSNSLTLSPLCPAGRE